MFLRCAAKQRKRETGRSAAGRGLSIRVRRAYIRLAGVKPGYGDKQAA
jgi:hypothetical protein